MFEPEVLQDQRQWVPPEQRTGRFGPMPPRKPETRTPVFWLVRQGRGLYLVNASGERLDAVHASSIGFASFDEETATWQGGGISYRDVPSGAAVKVDEYDDFYDLDYVLGMHLRIRSRRYPTLRVACVGEKGGIDEQVLLWNNGDAGKGVQIDGQQAEPDGQ
ncbi:hypothetical protein [Comamonas badia]|uniref:hypothetical protein n=1 Tax=Comamonas badia TaxID=265291 RepID=UPI00046347A6|nr:hypothetical protein [Comamonas badia]